MRQRVGGKVAETFRTVERIVDALRAPPSRHHCTIRKLELKYSLYVNQGHLLDEMLGKLRLSTIGELLLEILISLVRRA